jgi:RNA polymerase sigma-54 factor
MMHMENRLVQTQSQRLMLTQRMQQALQILQYSAQELEQHVKQELEVNPILEMVQREPAAAPSSTPQEPAVHDGAEPDDVAFDLDRYSSSWDRRLHEGRDLSVNPEYADRRDYYTNSITKPETLASHLMTQLHLAYEDERRLGIGERIIGETDERGYFTGSIDEIAQELEIPIDEVERVLYRIQQFEPVGVGARDVVECLLLQINAEYPDHAELKMLVSDHLDELQHRQIPKIAKAMKITPERVEELRTQLACLNPYPGYEYDSEPTPYVVPDLMVEKVDGHWAVSLTEEGSPELQLNPDYEALSKQKGMDKTDRSFLREKTESAKWLIRNIEQRKQTILKIGKAIMDVQHEFLDKGTQAIKPLTLQEIADIVGVHEATVSRTTRGKYIQTPQGLFELKYFFSPGLKSTTGEDQSSKSVQLMVKKMVDGEDKRKPLSDQKIADLLKKDGVQIARRTVTKYREALGIPATTLRKQY